jgi:UPF0755 protein
MKKYILIGLLLLIAAAAWIWGWPMYQLHYSKIDVKQEKLLYVKSTWSFSDLVQVIDDEGIMDLETFQNYSAELGFDDSKMEPGKYKAVPGMTRKEFIYGLKNGNQEIKDVTITFNNCENIEEMAGRVAPYIEADSAEIVAYATHSKTMEKYGFNAATMPALFLPDTYEVGEWDMTAEEFVAFMADQWKAFWNEERTAKRQALNLSESEVTTLASVVVAEQGKFPQEWETIAGLYLNRLRTGMKLQSDPTAKFCWTDEEMEGVQRILLIHLERDCPYNTYIHKGLPPGPISIPSKQALDAVLNAEDHDYVFMCAKADGSGLHAFAASYAQHLENARKFQRWMDERGL